MNMNRSSIDRKKARAFARFFGNELLTSAMFVTLVAFDTPIYTAAGWTSLLWVAIMLEMGYVSETWRLIDAHSPISQIIHAALSGLFAAGFLWP